jgi:hypothetical protein
MKTAKEMFEELGYKLTLANSDTIIYRMKNDYEDRCVYFNIGNFLPQTYEVKFKIWFDTTDILGWIPMNERGDEFAKHCAKCGYWMREDAVIYPKLHKAINKQCEEMGWLDA